MPGSKYSGSCLVSAKPINAHTLHGMVQKSYAGLGIRSSVLRANRSFFVSERKRANRSHRDPILNGRSFVKSDSLLGIKRGKTVKNCQKHMKNANCSFLRFCIERLEREQKITCFCNGGFFFGGVNEQRWKLMTSGRTGPAVQLTIFLK